VMQHITEQKTQIQMLSGGVTALDVLVFTKTMM
jgi:hypothetical protein